MNLYFPKYISVVHKMTIWTIVRAFCRIEIKKKSHEDKYVILKTIKYSYVAMEILSYYQSGNPPDV